MKYHERMFCNVLILKKCYLTATFSFVKKAKQFWQLTVFFCFHYLCCILPTEKLHIINTCHFYVGGVQNHLSLLSVMHVCHGLRQRPRWFINKASFTCGLVSFAERMAQRPDMFRSPLETSTPDKPKVVDDKTGFSLLYQSQAESFFFFLSALIFCTLTDKAQSAESPEWLKDILCRPAVYEDERRLNPEGQRQHTAFWISV